jgi:hypothetical protein
MRQDLSELPFFHGAGYTNLSGPGLGQVLENPSESFPYFEADLPLVREL